MTPAEIAARLTAAQRRALLWLPRDPAWITAADLGERMGGTARMKAQGLGRLGGTMAWRLMRKGLAALVPMRGTSGYRLTPLGREVRALAQADGGREVTDHPIIFSGPMVRALLDGRKTQTRRLAWKLDAQGNENATPWHDLYMEWQFRPIAGFFDYLAGRDGLIYSMKGGRLPRAMKGTPSSKGYLTVSLCGKDGIKTKAVHRLIAEAWFGPCPVDGWEVRHLNGGRTDNRIENLDWGGAAENWSDRRALGNGIHEKHHAAKITMADAEAIRSSPLSQGKLAAQYGLAQSTIWEIKAGRAWMPASPASGRNMALPPAPKLWVRESVRGEEDDDGVAGVLYAADKAWAPIANTPQASEDWLRLYTYRTDDALTRGKPVPSIHMPRWASRLTLHVEAVRVERLQEITEADAMAEGAWPVLVPPDGGSAPHVEGFRDLWNSLHGADAWATNPEVVVLQFRVAKGNIDA